MYELDYVTCCSTLCFVYHKDVSQFCLLFAVDCELCCCVFVVQVTGSNNFSTIRSNVCVYAGKRREYYQSAVLALGNDSMTY